MERKPLRLVLAYLGSIKAKTRNSLKDTLHIYTLYFRLSLNRKKVSNMFRFKDREPYDLVSGVVYEYTRARWNSSYYGDTERHLKIRFGEHLGISSLTFKKPKPPKKASIHDRLLQCDITLLLTSSPS